MTYWRYCQEIFTFLQQICEANLITPHGTITGQTVGHLSQCRHLRQVPIALEEANVCICQNAEVRHYGPVAPDFFGTYGQTG